MDIQNKLFIGVDVSKATLDISIDDKHFKIKNIEAEILSFIKTNITDKNINPALICLEPTGGYEMLALQTFQKAGLPVHRAHPNKVHAFAKAYGHFAKTDKLDARLLEKYAAFVIDREKGDQIISKTILELQALKGVERDMAANLHAYQCRVNMLNGKAKEYIEEQITFLKQEIEKVKKDLKDLIDSDEELKKKRDLLKSHKGVGDQVSISLLAELPELGSLSNKEIASLVGVAPKVYQSGIKRLNGHICGGRNCVRKSLYMAALVASRFNEKMRAYYEKMLAAGKPKKVALTAIMRKIIVCLNSMVKNNRFYDAAI